MSADTFFEVYQRKLTEAVQRKPGVYAYGPSQVPAVIGRMRAAWERGTANKDGEAVRATCKELGIKHTYTAIRQFIGAACVVLALCGVAHADGFQSRACKALRHGVTQMEPIRKTAPIRVTEEAPDGQAIRVFTCPALPGGEHMTPVLAEATR